MKRALLVLVCVGLMSGVAFGDYLVVKIDVNKDYVAALGKADGSGTVPGGEGARPMNPEGGQPGVLTEGVVEHSPRWVHAYFELRRPTDAAMIRDETGKQTHVQIQHKWGRFGTFPFEMFERLKHVPLTEQYEERKKGLAREKAVGPYLQLAQWCLTHVMLREFHETMQEATRLAATNPTVAGYAKMKAALGKPPGIDDPSVAGLLQDLSGEGYRTFASPAGHYTLATNLPSTRPGQDEVKRRLDILDSTYQNFFYWLLFNGKGLTPQPPPHRLVAVLVATPKEFYAKNAVWGAPTLAADGFTPRGENIAILSSSRLDIGYASLVRNTRNYLQGLRIAEADLISGDVWDPSKQLIMDQSQQPKIAIIQSMLLVQKALVEEGELASTSHHAIRQLLFASGLLPQNVIVPEWLVYGLASYFDTPVTAIHRGAGIPSWSNLTLFKHHRRGKRIGSAREALLQTISDGYFRQAHHTEMRFASTRDDITAAQAKEEKQIAQAAAWALIYYVFKTGKHASLVRYRDEIMALPRDLELSGTTLEGCFARAFDLTDESRVQAFADAWFADMENVHLPVPEAEQYTLRALTDTK